MKKTMILAVLGSVFAFAAFADEFKLDGEFKRINTKTNFPSQWIKNAPTFKQGTAALVAGKEADERAVTINSQAGTPSIYSANRIPVADNDKLEYEFEAKGTGNAYVGFYIYGAKNAFVGSNIKSVKVDSPNKYSKYKVIFTIKSNPARPCAYARTVFGVMGKGEITFTDLEVEKVK